VTWRSEAGLDWDTWAPRSSARDGCTWKTY
jgi:hypothetical protein